MTRFVLKLDIAGRTPRTEQAITGIPAVDGLSEPSLAPRPTCSD